ncbi:hypothetical protein BF93_14020 [Brachybacterium phenoliresistens]|uniref:Uncharacterized protein n=1 Tax=Brachybacterium phenoliresistens TaxID=396014 RepID=Z9JVR4_9MICO|nr:hypothetical protein [Brachybacterium phenoliresistens]EWS82063.1 hypothetical protein BF93_14020 [Brachybacterium phenoliresistens]
MRQSTREDRRAWSRFCCALAAGGIAAVIAGVLHHSTETREAVEALCTQVAQHANPGSDIDVRSTERLSGTQYLISGTITRPSTATTGFDCVASSDLHGGWGAEMGRRAAPK